MNDSTNSLKPLSSSICPSAHPLAKDLDRSDALGHWSSEPIGDLVGLVVKGCLIDNCLHRTVDRSRMTHE